MQKPATSQRHSNSRCSCWRCALASRSPAGNGAVAGAVAAPRASARAELRPRDHARRAVALAPLTWAASTPGTCASACSTVQRAGGAVHALDRQRGFEPARASGHGPAEALPLVRLVERRPRGIRRLASGDGLRHGADSLHATRLAQRGAAPLTWINRAPQGPR